MVAVNNKGYLYSTSATMHTMHLTLFTTFFYVQEQITLQKEEEKLQREKKSETRMTASILKQDPNT